MNNEFINALAAVLSAIALPLAVLTIFPCVRRLVLPVVKEGGRFYAKWKDMAEVFIEPARGLRPPSAGTEEVSRERLTKDVKAIAQSKSEAFPFDYYFLNHTSFLRQDKQEEFRRRTGVNLDHYDIRVIIDSYYNGALERVDRVEYILHHAYPRPIQFRRNAEDKFLLKELANGEYALTAKLFMKGRQEASVTTAMHHALGIRTKTAVISQSLNHQV